MLGRRLSTARHGTARCGTVRLGTAWLSGHGPAQECMARPVAAPSLPALRRTARLGSARRLCPPLGRASASPSPPEPPRRCPPTGSPGPPASCPPRPPSPARAAPGAPRPPPGTAAPAGPRPRRPHICFSLGRDASEDGKEGWGKPERPGRGPGLQAASGAGATATGGPPAPHRRGLARSPAPCAATVSRGAPLLAQLRSRMACSSSRGSLRLCAAVAACGATSRCRGAVSLWWCWHPDTGVGPELGAVPHLRPCPGTTGTTPGTVGSPGQQEWGPSREQAATPRPPRHSPGACADTMASPDHAVM